MRWIGLLAAVATLCVAGCSVTPAIPAEPSGVPAGSSSTAGTLAGSLPEYFQKVMGMADPAPDVRAVVERAIAAGRLDSTDYEVAHAAYAQCLVQHGFEPSFRKTPEGYYVELPYQGVTDQQALGNALQACSAGFALIDILYRVQQTNPSLVADKSLQAVQCLRRHDIVDAAYTVADFNRDRTSDTFPFDVYQVDANNCLYTAGYAYFKATG